MTAYNGFKRLTMCEYCCSIFSNYEQHAPIQCPLRESLYCTVCQVYGHHTNVCPDKAVWQTRIPEFKEQLISNTIREQYNINTITPLDTNLNKIPPMADSPVFEVLDKSAKSIRAAITSLGITSKTEIENRRVLERLCSAQGKKLIYLQDEVATLNKEAKKSKGPIKLKKAALVNTVKAV